MKRPRRPAGASARRPRRRRTSALAVTLAVLVASAGIGGAAAATLAGDGPSPSGPVRTVAEPGAAAPGTDGGQARPAAIAVPQAAHTGAGWADHPLMVKVQGWKSDATPQLTNTTPTGYPPALLRSYLHLSGTGKGQTVAVVDAFDNPYAESDITTYSEQFGLPVPCTKATKSGKPGCFNFSSVQPFGIVGTDPGWALESDLDVQTVHAIAPDASIVLVEARDNSIVSLNQAVDYAAGLNVGVISNSYGGTEFQNESANDTRCALASTLCVFSTGDSGNPGKYPAYDPHVLAVGGTTLALTPDGAVDFETAWCCTAGAGGGGISAFEPRPDYQDPVNSLAHRSIPDVSFDADPATGLPVYDTFGLNQGQGTQNGWFQAGGTSAGAPAWSGIVAAADQLRATARQAPLAGAGFQAQHLIYVMDHSAFRDITTGVNNVGGCATPIRTCQTQPGYDSVTGWGSPNPGIDAALAAAR